MTEEWLLSALTTPVGQQPKDFAQLVESGIGNFQLDALQKHIGTMGWKTGDFIFEHGGYVYTGTSAHIKDVLGETHKFAFEHGGHVGEGAKGRRIPFLYATRTPVGEPFPSKAELAGLVQARLEPLLDQAHKAPSLPISSTHNLHFTGSGEGWGTAGAEILAGKHPSKVAFFQGNANHQWIEVGQKMSSGLREHAGAAGNIAETVEKSFVQRHWGKMAGAAAVVAAGGWALHEMNKRSESSKSNEIS